VAQDRQAAQAPTGSRREQAPPGPTGPRLALPVIAMIAIILAIFGLLALGGGITLVISIVLMVAGLLGLVLYINGLAKTRISRVNLPAGLSGWDDDVAVADDAHEDLALEDLPPGSPERRELARRIDAAERKLPRDEWPADPRYKP
jgi:hypothetical protein